MILRELHEAPLCEGLIAIPPKMLKEVEDFAVFFTLWWAQDRLKGRTREKPEHTAALKAQIKRTGFNFPKLNEPLPKDFICEPIKVDLQGLPPQYSRFIADRPTINVAIDFRKDAKWSLGGWWNKKNSIIFAPLNLTYLASWPNGHPDDLEAAITDIKETAVHECRHMVQSILFASVDAKQLEVLPAYSDVGAKDARGSDYYTSQIEFDPTIGSAAHEFCALARHCLAANVKLNLSREIKRYVGAARSSQFDTFTVHPFFRYWKKKDEDQWRRAVRKFVIEVKAQLKA